MTRCWCEMVNGRRHVADGCPTHDVRRLGSPAGTPTETGRPTASSAGTGEEANARTPAGEPNRPTPHGTLAGYKSHGCHCEECRAANAAWVRESRSLPLRPKPETVGQFRLRIASLQKQLYDARKRAHLWKTRYQGAQETIRALERELRVARV